jgi:hypothetical protein
MENLGCPSDPIASTDFQTDWIAIGQARKPIPEAAVALEQLCRTYWYPLYAFDYEDEDDDEDDYPQIIMSSCLILKNAVQPRMDTDGHGYQALPVNQRLT